MCDLNCLTKEYSEMGEEINCNLNEITGFDITRRKMVSGKQKQTQLK